MLRTHGENVMEEAEEAVKKFEEAGAQAEMK